MNDIKNDTMGKRLFAGGNAVLAVDTAITILAATMTTLFAIPCAVSLLKADMADAALRLLMTAAAWVCALRPALRELKADRESIRLARMERAAEERKMSAGGHGDA